MWGFGDSGKQVSTDWWVVGKEIQFILLKQRIGKSDEFYV